MFIELYCITCYAINFIMKVSFIVVAFAYFYIRKLIGVERTHEWIKRTYEDLKMEFEKLEIKEIEP